MTRHLLSPRAQTDLDGIWDYSEQHWGREQAESYVRAIWSVVQDVAADPRRGRPCDDIRKGYFKAYSGQHVIFYRRVQGGIDVVRILHASMDFYRHL